LEYNEGLEMKLQIVKWVRRQIDENERTDKVRAAKQLSEIVMEKIDAGKVVEEFDHCGYSFFMVENKDKTYRCYELTTAQPIGISHYKKDQCLSVQKELIQQKFESGELEKQIAHKLVEYGYVNGDSSDIPFKVPTSKKAEKVEKPDELPEQSFIIDKKPSPVKALVDQKPIEPKKPVKLKPSTGGGLF